MNKPKTAVVIGAGIAGLTSACLLKNKGFEVDIFEASNTYGGKVGELKKEGFRFDKGPSLFTLPEDLDNIFKICGKNPREYYSYIKLPIITKYFYNDETQINAYSNLKDFKSELVQKLGESESKLNAYFTHIAEIYNFVSPIFLKNPITKFYKFLPSSLIESLVKTFKIDAFTTLHNSNKKWFSNEKSIQLFNRFATYNGSNPYKAPATLGVIPHLEHEKGAYLVEGGMRKIADALYQLATDLGCVFHFETEVEEILIENKKAIGVSVNKQHIIANNVFCNMDVNFAYPKLLKINTKNIYLKQEKSTSALVFYWGVNTTTNKLDVHNILFSNSYIKEFEFLNNGKVYEDPTVYIYISSKVVNEDAPEGMENWFTMINVPHDSGQNWNEIVAMARQNILKKIKKIINVDIENKIVFEKTLTPLEIQAQTYSYRGALYGNSSNNMFAAFLRHPNKRTKFKNLSFIGGSVHPGGGIPLCIFSAKIAVDEMD